MKKILIVVGVTFLCLLMVGKAQAQWVCTGNVFNDVNSPPLSPEFCDNIERFSTLGITKGCAADNPGTPENEAMYCPDLVLTRSQMAAFFMRVLDNLTQKRVTGFCPAGQFISQINADGTVECGTPDGAAYDSRFVNEGQANSIANSMLIDGSVTDTKVTGPISGSKISSTGLNADTLDGSHASEFALAGHNHDVAYVNEGQGSSITSTMIVDGTITNVDISTAAAIVGSKLASDGSVVKSLTAGTNISVVNNNNGSWTVNAVSLPIGAVIDWWRPDATWAVPSGFAICDGSIVNDAGSPLNGKTLPNLTNKFIMGVTNVNNIGANGGSDIHAHNVDINHDHGTTTTTSSGSHNHIWAKWWGQYTQWTSFDGFGSSTLLTTWGDGMDSAGVGNYPIAAQDTATYNNYTDLSGSHTHSVDLPALGVLNKSTTTVSNVPPYYGLLKIMRIK